MIEFELALFDPDDEDIYYNLSQYLENPASVSPEVETGSIAILVTLDGKPLIRGWNFGAITPLLLQLEAVIGRLEADKIALLRSGIDEQTVPYFLFKPVSADEVTLSLFILEDDQMAYVYPVPELDNNWRQLYDFVQANPVQLNYDRNDSGIVLKEIPCSMPELLVALRRELSIGYDFKERLGK